MTPKRRGFRQVIRFAILLGTISSAVLAHEGGVFRAEPPTPLCYCHCPYESGMRHCTKMCELPQYQNRWWAVSCQKKKNAAADKSQSPVTTPGSRKTNRTEQASL